ncbi:NAD(P)-binding protein [Auriculariales sp. MPI-PUGE-AT-0066]|nr:NAD(P)-binding protein [Auriculariales sp. MPI-PUGE-AT-0066]
MAKNSSDVPAVHKRWFWPGAINGIEGLQLVDAEVERPAAGEGQSPQSPIATLTWYADDLLVLVRIHAVSLNYREVVIAGGKYPSISIPEALTPACDCAGEVVAVGPGTDRWHVGNRVTSMVYVADISEGMRSSVMGTTMGAGVQGTLMEYRVFPAHALVRVPDGLSLQDVATFPCAGTTAYNALFGGAHPLTPGETVVVQGTGGVSQFGAQIAYASGAKVIVTSSSDEKLAQIKKLLGDDETINYKTHPDWHERVLKLTNGRGAEHVLDVVGGASLSRSLKALTYGGSVSVIGFLDSINSGINLIDVIANGANVRGITAGTPNHLRALLRLYEVRKLRPVIARTFEFEQVKEAMRMLESQDFIGKIVVNVVGTNDS